MDIGDAAFQTLTSRVDVLQLNTCQQLRIIRKGMVAYGELINGSVEVLCICNELNRTKD